MSYPQNPNQIILKNSFYSQGLREIDIWNYYQRYKNSIISQAQNRDLMMFLAVDDKILVKRKGSTTKFIRLNQNDFDSLVTGRTISIHGTMKKVEDIAIVDIDTDDIDAAKDAVKDCYNVLKGFPVILNQQIRFTGKSSFHIFCRLSRKMNIDSIRLMLTKIFRNSSVADKYTLSKARTGRVPNIDLFRNSFRGGFILLDSLSVIGLKCMEIELNELNSFRKEKAKIK